MSDIKKFDKKVNEKYKFVEAKTPVEAKTILEQIPYEEFRRLLEKTLKEDKKLYDMLANA
jgi:hypothetical protein